MAKTHVAWGGGHTLHAIGGRRRRRARRHEDVGAHRRRRQPAAGPVGRRDRRAARGDRGVRPRPAAHGGDVRRSPRRAGRRPTPTTMADHRHRQAGARPGRRGATVRPLARGPRVQPDARAPRGVRRARRGRGLGVAVAVVRRRSPTAVAGAGVVTTATRARPSRSSRADARAGAHVNAIGAITPERAELDRRSLVDRGARRHRQRRSAARAVVARSTTAATVVPWRRRRRRGRRPADADVTRVQGHGHRPRRRGPRRRGAAPRPATGGGRPIAARPSEHDADDCSTSHHEAVDRRRRWATARSSTSPACASAGEPDCWEPIIFRRAEIDAEIDRLVDRPPRRTAGARR